MNSAITTVLFIPLSVVALVTTLIGGILLALPLVGLVMMLAFQLVWLPILAVILASGWFWHKAPAGARSLASLIGIPFAILGNVALALMPSGPDPEDRWSKSRQQTLCQSWPWAAQKPDGPTIIALLEGEGRSFWAAAFEYAEIFTRHSFGLDATLPDDGE